MPVRAHHGGLDATFTPHEAKLTNWSATAATTVATTVVATSIAGP